MSPVSPMSPAKEGWKKLGIHSFSWCHQCHQSHWKKIQKKGDPLGIKLSCLPVDTFWFHLNICIKFQIFHVTGVTSVTSKWQTKKSGTHSFFWCHQCHQQIPEKGEPPWNQTALSVSQHSLVKRNYFQKGYFFCKSSTFFDKSSTFFLVSMAPFFSSITLFAF